MATDSVKQWEVKSSVGKHFDVLDGIRGVAILMVVAYHTFYTNPAAGTVMHVIGAIFGTGWIGVPIFFVLSGFLISYPFFRKREADNKFWWLSGYPRRRIGKIIPPFYLSIVIFGSYYFIRFSDPAYLHAAWQWALGLPNFIRNPTPFNAYWSLIVEAHFYILVPLLFLLTRGLKARSTAVILFALLFVVPILARQWTWPEVISQQSIAFLMARFPCQFDFFAWGILFAGVFSSLSGRRDEIRALSLFGYAGLIMMAVTIGFVALWPALDVVNHPTRGCIELLHLLPSASAFLMLFFVFDPLCAGSRLLGHAWLRFVGIVSYEWFLFHQPVVTLFGELFGHSRGNLIIYLGKTILPNMLTFGLSVLIYRFFSLPLLNRIRGDKPPATKPPAAPVFHEAGSTEKK